MSQNPVSRTINTASPVWATFAFNLGILALGAAYIVYNHVPLPNVSRLTKPR
jgi:hypothetical protein